MKVGSQLSVTNDGTISLILHGRIKVFRSLHLVVVQNPSSQSIYFISPFFVCTCDNSEFMLVTGMHPRVLVDGFEIAKRATLQFIEKFKTPVVMGNEPDKEILKMVARTTLRTKVFVFRLFYLFLLKWF